MKRRTKRIFSFSTLLKLFFLTSITAGNPVSTIKEGDNKVTIVHLTNESFKQMQATGFNGIYSKRNNCKDY